jgi:hypothetical protein
MITREQPWLADPTKEIWLILAPAILPVAAILIFQNYFSQAEVSTWWWIVLVLGVDVSHVYSTLFRLYWDKPTFQKYKNLLVIIPLAGFILAFGLHYYNTMIFWRVLAYVAVFHFVRQQYGFMRLYSRKERKSRLEQWIDTASIYNATLYPLLYWHLHYTSKLSWFIKGDFIPIQNAFADSIPTIVFISIIVLYAVKEIWNAFKVNTINIPKNLIMVGTYLSWYVGIISFQGDLIFTLLNVVAHGIPYMGLIWIYGEKKANTASGFSFTWKGVSVFILALLTFSYFEETIWDVFVWKDHVNIFPFLTQLPPIENQMILSLLVAVLVLPQVTHYVLDGFIWRFSKDSNSRI